MIIVRFTSGLGNQMFQYNFYRMLRELYPDVPVKADISWFNANNDHHGYELDRIFGFAAGGDVAPVKASYKEVIKVTGQIPPMVKGPLAHSFVYLMGPVNRIWREHSKTDKSVNRIDQLDGQISNRFVIGEDGREINPLYEKVMHLNKDEDYYFCGFWIEERYYKNRIEKLKKELVFPKITDSINLEMARKIRSGNSVSIHVRRGDYLSATYSGMFKALGPEYYKKAVDRICAETGKDAPTFYIFSDDPGYMEEAFNWLDNKVIVNINSGNNSYRDMQLMSMCKHNIIANSTFSQWGSLLNENENHLTVYPADYLAGEDTEEKTLSGWIRV